MKKDSIGSSWARPVAFLVAAGVGLALTSQDVAMASTGMPARVSVLRFHQQVEHILEGCRGFEWTEQGQLRTELERALVAEGVVVLERRDIDELYEREHRLVNADPRESARRGRFKTAQYTITGGLSEVGICENSGHENVSVGRMLSWLGAPSDVGLNLGRSKVVSTAKVTANLVAVETGQIVRTFEARSETEDSSLSVEVNIVGAGASKRSVARSPIERATNQAIRDLARQISAHLGRGA